MTLDDKIASAEAVIATALGNYRNPAVMSSFGKDSMVMLHLLRGMGIDLPIIFHADPWFPEKYAFGRRIIAEWELVAHDYPPMAVTLWEKDGRTVFVNHYQIGDKPGAVLQLPKNIVSPQSERRYLCGVRDVLGRPTGGFRYPWDAVFVGHKSSDSDQLAGSLRLHCDIKQNAGVGPDAVFPLRHWTDDDVWNYTHRFNVPYQSDRYDGRAELEDKSASSDYADVCIACCDRNETRASVPCPRLGGFEVTNISRQVPYAEPAFSYYGKTA